MFACVNVAVGNSYCGSKEKSIPSVFVCWITFSSIKQTILSGSQNTVELGLNMNHKTIFGTFTICFPLRVSGTSSSVHF